MRGRVATWVVVAAALTLAIGAVRAQQVADRSVGFLATELLVGLTLVATGALYRDRRPENRCGWLLLLAGLTWFIGPYEPSRNADVALIAFANGKWYELFLVWALLAYPTGRLVGWRDRAVLGIVAGALAVRTLSRLFLHVPPDFTGCDCVENRFTPVTDERWWRLVEDWFEVVFPVAVLLVLALVAGRWWRASRPGRRMLTPALAGAALLSAAVMYQEVFGWNAAIPSSTVASYYAVAWVQAAVSVAFLVGLVRLRSTRSAVVDLVAELGHAPAPASLGAALGRALGDPSLTLLPWLPAAGAYVDGAGAAVDLPVDRPGRAVTLIERRGEPVAALVHDDVLLEDPGLVNAVVATARLTIDNEQLHAAVTEQLAEVAASRARIVAAGDAERHRIERDLHDGAQQRLVTIALNLRLAEMRLAADADPAARGEVLQRAVHDLGDAIEELRDLARGIHPAVLTESGLGAALEVLAERSAVPARVDLDLGVEPAGAVAATAYFTVAEALTNVAKHAGATQVRIMARCSSGRLRVEVVDDGAGGADAGRGTGLRGVADRAAAAGGTMELVSRPGDGTTVVVELPCASS